MPDVLDTRLSKDILQEWKPTDKQKEFIRLPFDIVEALFGGAAGSGKSDVCLLLTLLYGFHTHPKFKGLILRRTFKDLEKEIILRSHHWFKPAGATYNEQKKRWTFPEGGILDFGHAENKEDIRKYDSTELNLVVFEEATHFLDFQYLYLIGSRLRSGTSELPAIARSSSTPGNVGHNFFRKRFVDPYPEGGKILIGPSGLKRIFIKAVPQDNPHLDPGYIQKLQLLPESERRAKLGDWYIYEGQVFDTFRPDGPLPDEPPNANHVIPDFDPPNFWPKIVAIDWGFTAKTWCGILAISPEGRFYLFKELVFERTNISTWATEIGLELDRYENIIEVRLDDNAWKDEGFDENVAEQFERYSNYRPTRADKGRGSRISGKLLVQECLRFIPKPTRKVALDTFDVQLADKILRIHGTKKYNEYCAHFADELPEYNLPLLQICKSCTHVIEVLPLCVYDVKDGNTEDVKEFDGDDPYDGLRYILRAAKNYIGESKKAFSEMQRIDAVQARLKETGDMNSFYRQMELLETQKAQSNMISMRKHVRRTT